MVLLTDDPELEPDAWRRKESSKYNHWYYSESNPADCLNETFFGEKPEPLYGPESIQRMKDRFVEEIEKRPNIQLTHAVLEELLEEAFISVKEKTGKGEGGENQ